MSKRVDGRQSFRRKHGHPLKRKQPMIKQSVTNESLVDEREQQPMGEQQQPKVKRGHSSQASCTAIFVFLFKLFRVWLLDNLQKGCLFIFLLFEKVDECELFPKSGFMV
ncbi:hypothetical protein EDC05_004481 [Coemansia umbellata]|uniref:Uncharacterized protein n=1 Tax=Coemansia umbellata TaxID=1424467 RepID=A0ABQ8PIH9_9FUNG|nr:hypothetical protein EDC05_004481 [Coemansia umbellata]